MSSFDVCGIGHALVDIQYSVTPAKLEELGVDKGVMTLVDGETQRAIVAGLGATPVNRASGGSAANTMITVASFGGRAHYAFQVGNDEWGAFYRKDLEAASVGSRPSASQPGDTGQCLVLVTPDADRTMNTFLGASATMGPHQVDDAVIAGSRYVYLEGYLLTTQDGLAACRAAALAARRAQTLLSLPQSDRVPRVCVTLGAEGTLIINGDGAPQIVEGFDAQAIDTTGAGDTFAGGVLYGLTHGLTLPQSAVLGNYGAAIVVSSFGPRLAAPLGDLIDDILARRAPPMTSSEVRR